MAECKIYKNGEVILCDDLHEVQDPGETVRFSEKRLERIVSVRRGLGK